MNPLVYHIVSGQVFFTGCGLLVLAAGGSLVLTQSLRRLTGLCVVLGVIAIAISSTPLPGWVYGLAALPVIAWVGVRLSFGRGDDADAESNQSAMRNRRRTWSSIVLAGTAFGLAAVELPRHLLPEMPTASGRSVLVIGDSISAGVGGEDPHTLWPARLARRWDLEVTNASRAGATTASARKKLNEQSPAAVVIVELGGNDLLGSTSVEKFATNLEAILRHLTEAGRQVVMFELPLPPFYHAYGRVQRKLAARYDVTLIPKRVFLAAIAGKGATLDSIHLTERGHRVLADRVGRVIGPGFPP